jgi:DNA-binding MarR family transcriptional regulator
MYSMNGGRLHRLGRRLIELSAAAAGEPGDLALAPGELTVLEDVIRHPASSIGEIHERTGYAQSRVSVMVSRLREHQVVETTADPEDGRRTRVEVTRDALEAITRRAARGIDETIERAAPGQADRVTALLEELAGLLL